MSPHKTTLTLLIDRELKARLEVVAKQDGGRSKNNWFDTYLMPVAESLVAAQEVEFGKPKLRPNWTITVRGTK